MKTHTVCRCGIDIVRTTTTSTFCHRSQLVVAGDLPVYGPLGPSRCRCILARYCIVLADGLQSQIPAGPCGPGWPCTPGGPGRPGAPLSPSWPGRPIPGGPGGPARQRRSYTTAEASDRRTSQVMAKFSLYIICVCNIYIHVYIYIYIIYIYT